jgi:polyisoprenoid-binding protein YceI
MKRVIPVLLASALSLSAMAAETTYQLDSTHTFPSFEVSHFGTSITRGRFDKTSGMVKLDPVAKTGKLDVVIETASIDTGYAKLEDHLRSEDFLNVAKYPTITFKSDKFTFDGANLVGVEGNLTISGVTKPVKLDVQHFKCGTHPFVKKPWCGANVVTEIKRSDFGVSLYVPDVGDTLKIQIQIEAIAS